MFLLGYDIGSSSVKASLVNAETGKCVSSAFFPKTEANIIAVNPGWAEQDPESWWENLKSVSYTHLDVYKRQILLSSNSRSTSSCSHNFRIFFGVSFAAFFILFWRLLFQ